MDRVSKNELYPVFLRLDRLRVLIVGAGNVGEEKLHFILKSSPNALIKIIAKSYSQGVTKLIEQHQNHVRYETRSFTSTDVSDADIVVAATENNDVNLEIYYAAKRFGKIVNVADTPALCDFYMGSIVTRGDLKIAISTNGKSPTFSKRFRQLIEEIIPAESHDLLQNLRLLRDRLKGNFEYKVKELNKITERLIQ